MELNSNWHRKEINVNVSTHGTSTQLQSFDCRMVCTSCRWEDGRPHEGDIHRTKLSIFYNVNILGTVRPVVKLSMKWVWIHVDRVLGRGKWIRPSVLGKLIRRCYLTSALRMGRTARTQINEAWKLKENTHTVWTYRIVSSLVPNAILGHPWLF